VLPLHASGEEHERHQEEGEFTFGHDFTWPIDTEPATAGFRNAEKAPAVLSITVPESQTILLRLAAFLVDSLSLAILLILPASLASYAIAWFGGSLGVINVVWGSAILILVVAIVLRDGYHGRSLGKRLLGLRLVTPSGYYLQEHGVVPTLCTSGLSDDDRSVDTALARPGAAGAASASRPRVSLDEQAWTALRQACPARPGSPGLDVESFYSQVSYGQASIVPSFYGPYQLAISVAVAIAVVFVGLCLFLLFLLFLFLFLFLA